MRDEAEGTVLPQSHGKFHIFHQHLVGKPADEAQCLSSEKLGLIPKGNSRPPGSGVVNPCNEAALERALKIFHPRCSTNALPFLVQLPQNERWGPLANQTIRMHDKDYIPFAIIDILPNLIATPFFRSNHPVSHAPGNLPGSV